MEWLIPSTWTTSNLLTPTHMSHTLFIHLTYSLNETLTEIITILEVAVFTVKIGFLIWLLK